MAAALAEPTGKTMVYEVDLGDGRVVEVEGPEGATAEQLQATVSQHMPDAHVAGWSDPNADQEGLQVEVTDDGPEKLDPETQKRLDEYLHQREEGLLGGLDPALRGAADSATLGYSDEISARMQSLLGSGTYEQNLALQRAIDRWDAENNAGGRFAGQVAGGFLMPVSRAGGVGRAAAEAGAYGAAYGSGSADGDLADRARGAVIGGVVGAPLGAAGGKLGEVLEQRAATKLANAATAEPSRAAQTVATGQKFGIDVGLDVAGDRGTQMVGSALDNVIGSAGVMQSARNKVAGQVGAAVEGVAGKYGSANSLNAAGEAAQSGAKQWISKSNDVIDKAYQAVPIPGKAEAVLDNTRTGLAELTKGFESNPELGAIWTGHPRLRQTLEAITPTDTRAEGAVKLAAESDRLTGAERTLAEAKQRLEQDQGHYAQLLQHVPSPDRDRALATLRQNLTEQPEVVAAQAAVDSAKRAKDEAFVLAKQPPMGGNASWEDLKRLRTIVGEMVGDAGLSADGNAKAALRKFYGTMSEDMRATAAKQGPEALRRFERANQLFADVQTRKETALASILGNKMDKPAEAAGRLIQTISKGNKGSSDIKKLAQIRASMPPDEWGDVAGTLIRLAGQPLDSPGREFNAQTFINTFDDMDDAAKNLLFGDRGRKELRTNLEEFSGLMRRFGERNGLRNTSQTAPNAILGSLLSGSLFASGGAGIGGAFGMAPAIAAGAGTSYGLAHLFTNPRFVKWATGYQKMVQGAAAAGAIPAPAKVATHLRLLEKVAASEPAIAQDALGLQRQLQAVFNGPSRVAAEEPNNHLDGTVPVENGTDGNGLDAARP